MDGPKGVLEVWWGARNISQGGPGKVSKFFWGPKGGPKVKGNHWVGPGGTEPDRDDRGDDEEQEEHHVDQPRVIDEHRKSREDGNRNRTPGTWSDREKPESECSQESFAHVVSS